MSRPGLTTEQIGELAHKSLENSIALLDEAEGLASFEKYPRAFSLGVLAAEEFGKFLMCFGGMAHRPEDASYWTDFWSRFYDHRPRYESAFGWVMLYLPKEEAENIWAKFTQHVRADLDRKLAGLYVDVVDGAVRSPDEMIGPEEAFDSLQVFEVVIRR